MTLCCQQDDRRDEVRRVRGLNGLDYVEVHDDQVTLFVYFLGKLPPELVVNKPGIEQYLRIEGGRRVTDIKIEDVDPVVNPHEDQDDYLVVKLDKYGDFSTYSVRLVGLDNIDPHYNRAEFSFKINCPSELDCAAVCTCEPRAFDEPEINYLAKDYQSFRQLMLDRLAVLVPDWRERHAADLGIMLVELLAYTGDYLSYYQDAVATEAYLDTARQRISVRRHARLVDYFLHEGCNARAWVCVEVSPNLELDPADTAFITGLNDALATKQNVLSWEGLRDVPSQSYEVFEPLVADRPAPLAFFEAHNEIHFYTWGERKCCLERGSTSATLLDAWVGGKNGEDPNEYLQRGDKGYYRKPNNGYPKKAPKGYDHEPPQESERALKLKAGDVLILEEVLGPVTGLPADADPRRRHAVRITKVTAGEDALLKTADGRPTPYLHIEWADADGLPFTFCISVIGAAPDCDYLDNVSVARGNVLLVDHGKTQEPEHFGPVPTLQTEALCECADLPGEIQLIPGRFSPQLGKVPLTFRAPLPMDSANSTLAAAAAFLVQDVRNTSPEVQVDSLPFHDWKSRYDLIGSRAGEKHFVVEIDNEGAAHLRFGTGELGYKPATGMEFQVAYRVGNGIAGNVGAESISRLVLGKTSLSGVFVKVRNPLPARGGREPEPVAEAKLAAPYAFRKTLKRAVTANDYQHIVGLKPGLQRTAGGLVWTGSWYEADVAVDPLGREETDNAWLKELTAELENFRRMGHDLAVTPARYVPIHLALEVCSLPHYQPSQVKAGLLDAFSNRILTGGRRGFFHPDNLSFGDGVYLSQIIGAAQAVAGVECVTVKTFHRLFEDANHEIDHGVLPLHQSEIAQLDNDPSYPERGKLEIHVSGGR